MFARSSNTRAPLLMPEGTFVKFCIPVVPNPEELIKFPEFPQFGWLNTFKNSACKENRTLSLNGTTFESDRSSFHKWGPYSHGLAPKVPGVVFWQTPLRTELQVPEPLPNTEGLIMYLNGPGALKTPTACCNCETVTPFRTRPPSP